MMTAVSPARPRYPLLLLHGIGVTGAYWDVEAAALRVMRRIVTWTLPAYGQAGGGLEDWAAVARSVIGLADARGVGRFGLLGHSFGGMIAQEVALRYPERLSALVLVSTAASSGSPTGEARNKYVADRLKALESGLSVADITASAGPKLAGPAAPANLPEVLRAASGGIEPAAYAAAVRLLSTFDRRADVGAIAAPTLVVSGELDTLAPPRVAESLAARIPGAKATIMPGVGHFPNLENAASFWKATAEFLEKAELERP